MSDNTQKTNPNAPASQPTKRKGKSTVSRLSDVLGSMNLAVTLLMMLAIASIIGTVMQQDQSFQDYIIKFGPYWTEVFNSLGLFHVYGAAWFVLVLVFLLISTTTCVTRNAPGFIRDMKEYNEKMTVTAYKHQAYSEDIDGALFNKEQAGEFLSEKGYKVKTHETDEQVTVAGLKGRFNRLGYIFTHVSIIIICLGALLDSNLLLKYRELMGNLVPETRTISLDEIPQKSWLADDNFSFRGSVNIPEGQKADVLFLPYEEGFLVQQLPFEVEVKDFRIEFYDTGMPKSFESDIILRADDLDEPIVQTIAVNHPLMYKNYTIYQSSFGDGGSILNLKIHPLLSPLNNPLSIKTAVDRIEPLKTPVGVYNLELNDFKMFNIVPASEEQKALDGGKMHNNGPTIIFKVRNDQGKAWEYENYMLPSKQEGRLFFMTGMRTSNAEPFRYLFIPADTKRSKARFFKFLTVINNPVESKNVLTDAVPKTDAVKQKNYDLQIQLMQQLLTLYRQKGFTGIKEFVKKSVPEEDQKRVSEFYFAQTSLTLQTLYLDILDKESQENENTQNEEKDSISDFDQKWFEDAITAIGGLANYGPPMYVEMESFKQVQSTGLQITKSPGKDIVYFGSFLLIMGVFFLFYLRQKRIWIVYSKVTKEITFAGRDRKDLPETEVEFKELLTQYQLLKRENV